MKNFGLIGKNIFYSFSKKIFDKKFKKENIKNCKYNIFDIPNIDDIKYILNKVPNIIGLNITIPYKQSIIKFLDFLSINSYKINSVNTIKIINKKIIGYNTDLYGFEKSFIKKLKKYNKYALILGSGGSSKAIQFVLKKLGIYYIIVTRHKKNKNSNKEITYEQITEDIINKYNIIINCTPIGTYPNINSYPKIPYEYLTKKHYLFDLVYNPLQTAFLKKGLKKDCIIKNGIEMLHFQAKKSWKIWNNDDL